MLLHAAACTEVMLTRASPMQCGEAQAYLWHPCYTSSDPKVVAKEEPGLRNECAVQE